jgi:DNA-binding NarL/FixJ family response regulator
MSQLASLSEDDFALLRHIAAGRRYRTFALRKGLKLNTVNQRARRIFIRLGGRDAAIAVYRSAQNMESQHV